MVTASTPVQTVMGKLAASPAAFRDIILIDTQDGPQRLGDVMDPWQREDHEILDAGWQDVIAKRDTGAIHRAYLERGRGHDKTTGIALMVLYALVVSPKPIRGVAAACDREQAQLIRDAILITILLNPWLDDWVVVHNYEVTNRDTGAKLVIVATDAAGNYGKLVDFIICDEVTHWIHKAHQDNWEALFSTAAKHPWCMLIIISNAGIGQGTGWQWEIREKARTRDDWYFHRIDGPKASWITAKQLDEQRAILPGSAYRRLWLNQWVPGSGDALSVEDIDAAFVLKQPQVWPGWSHVIGLDLGVKHDHSAMVVLAAKPGSGIVKVSEVRSWKPTKTQPVIIETVRNAVRTAFAQYGATACFFDPHQCIDTGQLLRAEGFRMEEVTFAAKSCTEMATAVLQCFTSRTIQLYPHEDLRRDLLKLMIVEKPGWGFKIEAAADEHGHADRAIALAIALPVAAAISKLDGRPVMDGLGNNVLTGRM